MTLVQAFSKWIGLKESKGKNRSPVIDDLNSWMGVPMGSPYCATTCSRALYECDETGKAERPKTASSVAFRNWFIDRRLLSYDAQALLEWHGAFGGWTNEDGKHGHVFLIEKRYTSWFGLGKKVVAIGTLEANSNSSGSRDGEGFVRNKRKVPIDRGHKLWFANASDLPGGRYWK